MKKWFLSCICAFSASFALAQNPSVLVTGFEEGDGLAFSGAQVSLSVEDDASNPDGVPPFDGNGVLYVEYDNSGSVWSFSDLNFAETVDASGMRDLNLLVYFLPDSSPNDEGEYELRMRLYADITGDGEPNEVAFGYKSDPRNPETGELIPHEEVPGQWVQYSWEIDKITSEEHLSGLAGIGLSIMPGDEGKTGAFYLDNIHATRPADFPTNLEEVLIYDFDNEDLPITPAGWEPANGQMVIGDGFIEPSQGTNYMEIWIGENWTEEVRTTDAKTNAELWAQATDILMDVYIGEEFDGGWLLINPSLQSGGNDAEGNALEKVNGWDSYGERNIRWAGYWGQWNTIAWPIRREMHIDALTNDDSWFIVSLITNKDGAQAGKSLYVDNFRLAIPAEPVQVENWSLH